MVNLIWIVLVLSASAALVPRNGPKGFACLVDQLPFCCKAFQAGAGGGIAGAAVETGCENSLGPNGLTPTAGYATCPADGSFPVCCAEDAPPIAGVADCDVPSAINLPAPIPPSKIASVPRGSFTCIGGLAPVCRWNTVLDISVQLSKY